MWFVNPHPIHVNTDIIPISPPRCKITFENPEMKRTNSKRKGAKLILMAKWLVFAGLVCTCQIIIDRIDFQSTSVESIETNFGLHTVKIDTEFPIMSFKINECDIKHVHSRECHASPMEAMLCIKDSSAAVRGLQSSVRCCKKVVANDSPRALTFSRCASLYVLVVNEGHRQNDNTFVSSEKPFNTESSLSHHTYNQIPLHRFLVIVVGYWHCIVSAGPQLLCWKHDIRSNSFRWEFFISIHPLTAIRLIYPR